MPPSAPLLLCRILCFQSSAKISTIAPIKRLLLLKSKPLRQNLYRMRSKKTQLKLSCIDAKLLEVKDASSDQCVEETEMIQKVLKLKLCAEQHEAGQAKLELCVHHKNWREN
jgi:hypothetical protein